MAEYIVSAPLEQPGLAPNVHERIVRCRDCGHAEHFESGMFGPFILCRHFESEGCKAVVDPDGFCKWGEERDADGDS